jgi:iron complex outermembrane receptor protein
VTYNYEPYGAERIVIPKGPASTLYGQAAPGGLVNYVSKRPTFEKRGEVGVEYGSYDHVQGQFDVSGPIGDSDEFAYRLVGLARDADTKIDYVQNDRIYLAPSVTWAPSEDTELTLLARYQKDESKSSQAYPAEGTLDDSDIGDIPRNRFTGEPDVDRYDRTTYSLGYEFEHAFDDSLTFRQKARYTDIRVDDISVYAGDFDGDRTLTRYNYNNLGELDSLVVDNQFQIDFDTGKRLEHVVLAGIDYQHANLKSFQSSQLAPALDIYDPQYGADVDIDAATPFADQSGTQNQIGFYLQDQITFDERWVATLGGRYDRASRSTDDHLAGTTTTQDDNDFTWRGSLLYAADNGLSPYFAYSEGFLPSLGADANGNAFEPETSTQYEVGLKYMPEGQNYGVTVALFDLTRENYLTFDPNFVTRQVGEAQSQGVEIEGVASLAEGLNITASYAYIDAEITQSAAGNEGNRPQLSPEHQASVWADYTIQKGALADLGFGAGVRYKDSVFGDNANTSEVPDVTLFDAAVHYDWQNYEFAVNARNLFDKEYVGSSFERPGGTGRFFTTYGEARSIIGSVKYRW